MYHRIPENKYLLIKLNLCSTQYYFTGFTKVWSMGAAKAERLIFIRNALSDYWEKYLKFYMNIFFF